MSGPDRWARRLGAGWLCVLAGCASNTAPAGWLPTPQEAGRDAYGGWIELTVGTKADPRPIEGELLAASPDTLWVLSSAGAREVPASTILDGKLTGYNARAGTVAAAAAAGFVSTITNGVVLLLTAPAWVIVGTVATAAQARAPVMRGPGQLRDWTYLAPFARFPRGLPAGIRLDQIRSKPPRTVPPTGPGP